MKTRSQLMLSIDRLHKQADDLRLCIGLGDDSTDQQDELDAILDKIDRRLAQLADHDARQAVWRAKHVAGIIRYRARHRQLQSA